MPRTHKLVHESEFADMITQLVNLLGIQLVAIIGNETQDSTPQNEPTLRFALQLAIIITRDQTRSPRVAQAWFQGSNPILGYESPAMVLRNGRLNGIRPKLINAAQSFTGN